MMEGLQKILVVSATVEALVQIIKSTKSEEGTDKVVLLSIVLGVGLTFIFKLDLFEIYGMEIYVPYAGIVLSGVLLSRGSNIVHDIFDKLNPEQVPTKYINKEDVV